MRKTLALIFGLALIVSALGAQTVDEAELRTALERTIQFQNFTGPEPVIETDTQIRSIGSSLAGALPAASGGRLSDGTSTYAGRYRVQRILPAPGEALRGADIIEILPGARVDHVDNIRRIISGYLIEAFGYNRADADTLSFFATIYNAVHRGALGHFTGRYSTKVLAVLAQAKVGLSLVYSEWPGNTQVVIPLSAQAGSGVISSVSAAELADPQVIENLRDSDGDGIEQRQDIADLIDRSVEQERDAIAEEREAAAVEREALEQREQELERELAQTSDLEERAELEQEREEIAQQRVAVEQRETELDNRQTQAQQDQTRGDQIREEIAADVRSNTTSAAAVAQPTVFATASQTGDLVRVQYSIVDATSGSQITPSNGAVFYGRTRITTPQGWIGIVETSAASKEAVLGLFDTTTLAEKKRTEIRVYYLSDLVFDSRGSQVYAIIQRDGDWYLGQFDTGLNPVQYSTIAVQPQTAIIVTDSLVLVTRKDGRLARLQKASLRVE